MQDSSPGIKKGSMVRIGVSEPWDVVTALLPSPVLSGLVIDGDMQDVIVIRLDEPLSYAGHEHRYFLTLPRYIGGQFDEKNRILSCNLVSMTEADHYIPPVPAKYHGDLMLIGTVTW
jgi:hypothetical protein